jgi:hypothetical protein
MAWPAVSSLRQRSLLGSLQGAMRAAAGFSECVREKCVHRRTYGTVTEVATAEHAPTAVHSLLALLLLLLLLQNLVPGYQLER